MGRHSQKSKRKGKRKKSSETDSERKSNKRHLPNQGSPKALNESRGDCDLSDVLSQANGVLYGSDTHDISDVSSGSRTSNSELDLTTDSNPVFSPARSTKGSSETGNSGGQTCTEDNMASSSTALGGQGSSAGMDGNQFAMLMNMMQGLKKGQEDMTEMFDSKLDKFRNELLKNIDQQVNSLRQEISKDVKKQASRIDEVMATIQTLNNRMDTMEQSQSENAPEPAGDNMDTDNGTADQSHHTYRPRATWNDTDVSVIASGMPFTEGEDLVKKAQDLIAALGPAVESQVTIRRTVRFRSRFPNKPGPVKITFRNVQEKIRVLRNKMVLKNTNDYKEVYVKSCKSHAERLIELNARTLLRQMPDGRNFRVDANGRIQPRERQNNHQDGS